MAMNKFFPPKIKNLASFKKDLLKVKSFGLDSMCFLYQFADHPHYAPLTDVIFNLLEQNKIKAITTTISIVEVFVQAEKSKNQSIIQEYETTFKNLPNFEVLPVDWHMARLASKIRALYPHIKTPDSIQIGATLISNYRGFITNDTQLKQIKELKVIILDEYI